MDEEIAIISKDAKNEKIKSFILKNKNKIYSFIFIFITFIFSTFFYQDYKKKNYLKLANKYVVASTTYESENKDYYIKEFNEIINTNNATYAPLSLFFLIDNNIIESNQEVNLLFDQIIKNASLDKEMKNLLIYKKALFNSEFKLENELIEILKPIINSDSIWKSHSLLLLGDYFLSKDEKQKAKDFYIQILSDEKTNQNIAFQAQSRLRSNFSE